MSLVSIAMPACLHVFPGRMVRPRCLDPQVARRGRLFSSRAYRRLVVAGSARRPPAKCAGAWRGIPSQGAAIRRRRSNLRTPVETSRESIASAHSAIPAAFLPSHDDALLLLRKKGKAPMDSTLGPAQTNTHQDSGEIKAVEEALSRVLQEATAIASDRRTDMAGSALRVAGPSIDATLHSAELKDDRFQRVRPSFARRASRALARFLITFCIGVAATLAWQSYGDAAREMIASSSPQLAWLAPQAAPVAQTAPDMIMPAAPAAPSPDRQQLNAMSLGLAVVRQSVDQLAAQLAAGQEQMTREITKLRATEQDILDRISAPPPRPAAAPARKPVPVTPPSPQAPPVR